MLKCVEGNNADWVAKLPRHEIGDDSFEVRPLDFGFAVNAALPAEAINYEVDGLIRETARQSASNWTYAWQNPTQQNRQLNKICHNLFRSALVRLKPRGVVCDRP